MSVRIEYVDAGGRSVAVDDVRSEDPEGLTMRAHGTAGSFSFLVAGDSQLVMVDAETALGPCHVTVFPRNIVGGTVIHVQVPSPLHYFGRLEPGAVAAASSNCVVRSATRGADPILRYTVGG